MRNKDYRELQISSSSLAFIFLSIILLGIIIFLLGVSVGKKQVRLAADTSMTGAPSIEKVVEEKPSAAAPAKDPVQEEIASHKQAEAEPEPARTKPASRTTTTPAKPKPAASRPAAAQNRFYIQAGAYQSKDGAMEHAANLRQMGFPCQVHDPTPGASRQLYKVRVGGYSTRAEAESWLAKVADAEKKTSGDYFITRY